MPGAWLIPPCCADGGCPLETFRAAVTNTTFTARVSDRDYTVGVEAHANLKVGVWYR